MKRFIFSIMAMLMVACMFSCQKEAAPIADNQTPIVSPQVSPGWLDSSFVAFVDVTTNYAEAILQEVGEWESPLTMEQFNMIYSMYTGELHPIDFYWLSVNGYRDLPTIEGLGTNTILKKGMLKKIKSVPGITEYLVANIGETCDYHAAYNFYSIGDSGTKITWQDAANSAFAESLEPITDFNPELIDWENITFYSGCTYEVQYPFPLTVLHNGEFIVYPALGTVFLHATCWNENMVGGQPTLPLLDYYVEIPILGTMSQLYFIS